MSAANICATERLYERDRTKSLWVRVNRLSIRSRRWALQRYSTRQVQYNCILINRNISINRCDLIYIFYVIEDQKVIVGECSRKKSSRL